MKANIFSQQTDHVSNTSKSLKRQIFYSIRFRILAWYLVLTSCTVLISVVVTRQIFCNVLESRTQETLVAEVNEFERLIEQQVTNNSSQLSNVVAEVLSLRVTARNEYILALIAGQIVHDSSLPLPEEIAQQHDSISRGDFSISRPQNSTLLEEWNQVSDLTGGELIAKDGPIYYAAKPITVNGDQGIIIAVRDARADYQTGTRTIILVIKVATVVLIIFSAIAWVTAGRVLFPLRQVTKTAQTITQTDMSKRIAAKGNDEIAELSATFNAMLDRLSSAFETQREFLKDAGHELRTPITVIQGHLEILKYRPEKQEETIALVTDELDRMGRLVNDLLLIAKAEQPRFLSIKLEELDWFTEELYFKSQALATRNWQLESKGLSPVAMDKGRLTQAAMNLVQNAIRHTEENDTIALGSTVRHEYAYLWVRDTGSGIATEDQERIFERFARASEGDRYSAQEGAGLGLSIVEAIATAHNGWVELESELGTGSTFTIVFPLSQEVVNESNPDCRRQPPHRRVHRSRAKGTRIHNSLR
ncbi:MAG: HAMP domain-containing sensor histidine kinase [Cyanobacteria bacterium P01_G01_bin.39]